MNRVYYQFENVLSGITGGEGRDPNLKRFQDTRPEKAFSTFMKPGIMKGKTLGACLDSCRIGTMTTCIWPADIPGLMGFIQRWRDENYDNESMYHEEPIEKVFKRFELPKINHPHCPRDKTHKGIILDAAGRVRCAHRTIDEARLGFLEVYASSSWDEHSQTKYFQIREEKPRDPSNYDEETGEDLTDLDEWEHYLQEQSRYDAEEPIQLVDVCYSIIKEPSSLVLPFETILTRENIQPESRTVYCRGERYGIDGPCRRLDELDVKYRHLYRDSPFCSGHREKNHQCEFTFDGWTMAYYLLRWKQQGNAPWFATKKEHWAPREHLRICSGD